MKLTAKLISGFVLCMIIILAVDGYFSVRRESEFIIADMEHDASLLGHAIEGPVMDAWRTGGRQRALELVKDANKQGRLLNFRWVWVDASQEEAFRPKVPREKLGLVLRGKEASFKEHDEQGNGFLCTYIPIEVEGERPGALEISESLAQVRNYTHRSIMKTVVLTVVLTATSILVSLLLGLVMLGKPLNHLMEKVQRVGKDDFSEPLRLKGHDELSRLAATLNAMCEQVEQFREKIRIETESRIAALEQLRHEDRLKTVGRLASGIAHELGTPLNVISGRAGMIARGNLSSNEIVENANTIKDQSDRITTIIRQLLDFARRRSTQKSSADLRQMVRRTLDLIAPLGRKQKVEFFHAGDDDTTDKAEMDAEQIQQVLVNILTNALHAMPQGGRVEVGIRHEHARPPEGHDGLEDDYLCIYVQDEGEGIPKENMPHVFEPFFTTKDTGKGTGLGLSIAYGIVREHGGWIDVESEIGKGSCFSIYLPQEGK